MKHFKVAFLAVLITIGFTQLNAQDKNNPWQIGFGVNAVDYSPTNPNNGVEWGQAWFTEFFNAEEHYNMIPAITRVSVGKYLTDGFSFEIAVSLNKIEFIGDLAADDLSYFGLDGAVKYDLNEVIGETAWFDPYVSVGGGYTWVDDTGIGSLNGGLGANVWFNDNVGLNIGTQLKYNFEDSNLDANIVSGRERHFQHYAGLVIKFGGTDTDEDGIYDKFDACPEVFGLAEFDGCPDTDSDGIIDSKDACPETAGLAELNGCPDADADGIADKDDACPNEKGTKANNGCPDTDGDGLIDKNDSCPKVAGPIANKGCPWPDTDGDGVLDKDDNCVDLAGPSSNNGCPEISEAEVAQLIELFKIFSFEVGSDVFLDETPPKMDEAAAIMVKYPTAKFTIEGHTDSVDTKEYNQDLSERRASKVVDYLVSKGVNAANLSSKGFGEERPVATNLNKKGRNQNRRVEVKLVD